MTPSPRPRWLNREDYKNLVAVAVLLGYTQPVREYRPSDGNRPRTMGKTPYVIEEWGEWITERSS